MDDQPVTTPNITDYHKPVAYDANGNPLYAHPPTTTSTPNHSYEHGRGSKKHEISEEDRRKHEESKRLYPFLNLSEGEYVISAIRRHPISLVPAFFVGGLLISLSLTALFFYPEIADAYNFRGPMADVSTASIPIFLFIILVSIGVYIAYYIYLNNKFFLTNESVIQEIQTSLFRKNEQTVSLTNIEDASFTQHGLIAHFFGYGSIRLSTEGDETTYRFSYVENPKEHIATINNAIESFKKYRPTDKTDD